MRIPSLPAYSKFLPKVEYLKQPPILILHCILGCRRSWDTLAQDIANKTKCKVYTLDACNHGDSQRSFNCSFVDMARDIELFLVNKKIPKCHFLGHSMGGRSAMAIALQNPSLVQTLTVIDVSPIETPLRMPLVIHSQLQILRKVIKTLPKELSMMEAKHFCNNALEQEKIGPESYRVVILDTLRKDGNSFHWASDLELISETFETQLLKFPRNIGNPFHGPVRFIASEKPIYLKLEDHMSIYKLFPKAEISYMAGTTHQLPFEKPEELVKIFMEFFDRNRYLSKL